MPRFPVNFRRKSTAADDQNGQITEPSFRVLERPNHNSVNNVKSFDGAGRLSKIPGEVYNTTIQQVDMEDNLFAGLNSSSGSSGSSSNTKTTSDNSSRHSNVSNAPSTADYNPVQEDWRNSRSRKPLSPVDNVPPIPPVHKSPGLLKQAGRTFSFGGNKKHSLSPVSFEEPAPPLPNYKTPSVRSRATTNSTVTSPTPPKLEDADFQLDLGGELSTMLNKFDKRSSVMTLKERDATNSRPSQPSPLHFDHSAPVEPPLKSLNSQNSSEGLLASEKTRLSPIHTSALLPVPSASAVPTPSNRSPDGHISQDDDEVTTLLSDSLAASQFLSNSNTGRELTTRQKGESGRQSTRVGLTETYAKGSRYADQDDDNLFDKSLSRPTRIAPRIGARSSTAPQTSNKVMTPEEFEKYRQDRVKEERLGRANKTESDKEDEDINYDDDEEDDLEKSKQLAKQRRKQEAHLAVYRQRMMKVTGESANPTRPPMTTSLSTPNLPLGGVGAHGSTPTPPSDSSEEDEEVPLAILAAHGFPNKNRPPVRLSTMGSNPNIRASMQSSAPNGGASAAGEGASGRLPPFARKLPQDPYLGAGLINQAPRESMALSGGAPARSGPMPTGGLVGVIAHEERARALRRGSPALDNANNNISQLQMNPAFDPINGIPSQMMYPMGPQQMQNPMLDQTQMQMQQLMQMQMQFMQMMASQQGPQNQLPPSMSMGHMPRPSLGSTGDMSRNSFMGPDVSRNTYMGPSTSGNMPPSLSLDLPQGLPQSRTMSMVQPSSASWVQQAPQPGYPSIHVQGGGYAPSIAPSERSNIGLPGRYRPVSSTYNDQSGRTSTMGAYSSHTRSRLQPAESKASSSNKDDEDDDDEGWAAMKAKRDQKKGIWRSKKSFGSDFGALIN
ncbi:hypothetical protein GGS20DRAFT_169894 [Poronia punctata]|nr:hypothetical protein GGS20DRAFT_169894 [Poronia punctata]